MSKNYILQIVTLVLVGVFSVILFLFLSGNVYQSKTANKNDSVEKEEKNASLDGKKVLIAYFSKTNHTEELAKYIQEVTNGDLFKIETKDSYPEDDQETKEIAKEEKEENERPELKDTKDITDYDVIFIGFPIWWETCPMAVFTYLESQDFEGKIIVPFITHEGSGFGNVEEDIKKSSNASKYLDGLAIHSNNLNNAKKKVEKWIQKLDFHNTESVENEEIDNNR